MLADGIFLGAAQSDGKSSPSSNHRRKKPTVWTRKLMA